MHSPPSSDHEFAPTPFQARILAVLAGCALPTEDLAREVGDPGQFFSGRGGFWELRHRGLIVHDARIGNYRPDAPPPGFLAPAEERGRPPVRGEHLRPQRAPATRSDAPALRCDPPHDWDEVNRPHLVICRPGQDA